MILSISKTRREGAVRMELKDTIREVLGNKGREICAVAPETSVYDALEMMAENDIGALLVMDEGRLLGIMSERDYARKVILVGKTSRETLVEEIMHAPEPSAAPTTTVSEAMRMMTEARVRHLPVLDGERVTGVVSIGDLVNHVINAQQGTIQALEAYVSGTYPA
ncbi:MAG TPA: CBS domain-containing protein [Bryobacteraceae bacterium]|nr:CBS domain-containing protein [Bryobacteraceae bacterium]